MSMSNRLDLDQAGHFVGPDHGPNYLHKLSADDTRLLAVKPISLFILFLLITFNFVVCSNKLC